MPKMRPDVCRAILLTSIVWLLLDVVILFYYLDKSLITPERSNLARSARFAFKQRLNNTAADNRNDMAAALSPTPMLPDEANAPVDSQTSIELDRLLASLDFDPNGPGAGGNGIQIEKEKQEEMREMFKQNQFNLMASDRVSINRTLPDYRLDKCKSISMPTTNDLPRVSIIIVFHNEAWSTLLRTLHSVVNRTPLNLLSEIILIDDQSERDYLKKPLELYTRRFPIPVHLVHLPERSGLIRARLAGSAMARGKILLFLDAHVEVTIGWLEPLVARVAEDRRRVVAPIIDVISDDSFEYVTASDTTWGGFNWHLNFRWYPVPDREMQRRKWDRSTPIQTPTIAGGLFAIDKQYFYEIGSYDEGMQVWGGENLEISFRVWMCGGVLEIHPCSRVGHVFRKQTPYTFPGGTAKVIHHNARRTAEVWMDEYKQFFYAMVAGARNVDVGNVTERRQLRKKLQCKSFKWYLENVYPECPVPANFLSIGEIKNPGSRLCIDTMGHKTGQQPGLSTCHGQGGNQAWSLTGDGEIRTDETCLAAKNGNGVIQMEKCAIKRPNPRQQFRYIPSTGQLMHIKSQMCLAVDKSSDNPMPALMDCDGQQTTTEAMSDILKWELQNYRTR